MRVHQKFEFDFMKRYLSDTKYILYAHIQIYIHIYLEGVLWEEGYSTEKKNIYISIRLT